MIIKKIYISDTKLKDIATEHNYTPLYYRILVKKYSQVDTVIKKLEDKGYLIKSEKNSNLYLFKEKSDKITTKKSDKIFNLEQEEVEDIKKKYFSQEDCQNN